MALVKSASPSAPPLLPMRIQLPVSSPARDTHFMQPPIQRRRLFGFANPAVPRTGASRVPQAQIQRHRRLAPVADLALSITICAHDY